MKILLIIAAISGFLAVAIGAAGSHALAPYMDEVGKDLFDRASLYHHLLSLALLGCAILWPIAEANASDPANALKHLKVSAALFLAGIFLFSGLLYLMAIFPDHPVKFLIPFGGLSIMLAWLNLIRVAMTLKKT
ncbi:hypothetical protein MNBD_ALPHA02-2349 [hydrothermal vent metagenome]|uniref:COG2363 n=1 Tax=hydrothermal vent metagenome TaxID=652676 RepID=A0A3B0SAY8_9ZZZZ